MLPPGIGGDLIKSYLKEDVRESDIAKFGIDIWLTTTAIVKKAKICEESKDYFEVQANAFEKQKSHLLQCWFKSDTVVEMAGSLK